MSSRYALKAQQWEKTIFVLYTYGCVNVMGERTAIILTLASSCGEGVKADSTTTDRVDVVSHHAAEFRAIVLSAYCLKICFDEYKQQTTKEVI